MPVEVNKVIYGNQTLIDLTGDTVTTQTLLSGATAHDKSGATIQGACPYDSDTSDATAAVAEILAGKDAYARGAKITGTMPNNGGAGGTISTKNGSVSIPLGFHDGSGSVTIDAAEISKIIPGNIKEGVEILGETGTFSGGTVTAQSKNATPSTVQYVVQPDAGYDYLSQVTIAAIPYTETQNAAGGTTVTIGG